LLRAGEGAADQDIAESLHVARTTVERLRKRFVEDGLDAALGERPRPGGKRKLDMHQEAHLIALTCGPASAGPSPLDHAPSG
jgi:transposase